MTGFYPQYIAGDGVIERVGLEVWAFLASRAGAKVIVASDRHSFFCEGVLQAMAGLQRDNPVLTHEFLWGPRAVCQRDQRTWRCSFRNWTDAATMAETVSGVIGKHVMFAISVALPVPEELLLPIRACVSGTKSHSVLIAPILSEARGAK